MAIVQIVEIAAPTPSNVENQAPASIPTETIEKLKALIGTPKGPQHFTIGTQVQTPSTIQITSEWKDTSDLTTLTTNPFTDLIHTTFGHPSQTFHIPLPPTKSIFTPHGAASSSITEFVMNYHPLSTYNATYKSKIETDFARFYKIFDEEAEGAFGLTTSWVAEDLTNEASPSGEKARCFFVFNGWDRMEDFEKSTSTESFKMALPILLAWGVVTRLWHVKKIF